MSKSKWQSEAEALRAFLNAVIDAAAVELPAIGHTSDDWDVYRAMQARRLAAISANAVQALYGDPDRVRGACTKLETLTAEPLGYPVEPAKNYPVEAAKKEAGA
jgi:hypothetical protein